MSEDLGNQLPQDLFDTLYIADPKAQGGTAIVVSTVDAEGWSHPALLSFREVGARDRETIRVVTFNGTGTTTNMRENGKLTLIFIDPTMVYYVKGTAKEIPAAQAGHSNNFATMDVSITSVLADFPGEGEESARITSGITFTLPRE
jgi:hypothetical protein